MSVQKRSKVKFRKMDQVEISMQKNRKMQVTKYPDLPYQEKCDLCRKKITNITDANIDQKERLLCPECYSKVTITG